MNFLMILSPVSMDGEASGSAIKKLGSGMKGNSDALQPPVHFRGIFIGHAAEKVQGIHNPFIGGTRGFKFRELVRK